ncbi:NAD(P)-binding domain-containing protein [Fructobacillus sp. M1-13]|uniref:Pyrroline-5-carboxylate reductase n=1 Tax=Fructobacillus papyriferae TaxID=2713171 RepID=A0ABS5QNJ5_9LACO|nr:pyrroline-5-carboxylate reductase dimerization domain-containing protein [Fructobacillus papyriferae]MBS9334656.1 NAD(P)-binding domain-containing protein [Fructobacillus papyriferae]MCD2158646.1 NAD(P)-binding domain-containing protein [Fructobacillus papyriferae]
MMKVGIVGLGHMGTAMAEGFIKQSQRSDLSLVARTSNAKKAIDLGLTAYSTDQAFLSADLDVLILAVPANVTVSVLKGLVVAGLSTKTLILSAAAAVSSDELAAVAPTNAIFPFIPNIPVSVNAGTISLALTAHSTDEQKAEVQKLLESLGDVLVVKEAQLSIAGVVGGCSPAFVDVLMDAMEDAAVAKGMDREKAKAIVASSVRGTALLAQSSDLSFADLKGQITSPGGTTIQGVLALDKNGFRHAVHEAIQAANR